MYFMTINSSHTYLSLYIARCLCRYRTTCCIFNFFCLLFWVLKIIFKSSKIPTCQVLILNLNLKASPCRTWTNWTSWGLPLVVMLDASASGQRVLSASWMSCTAPGVNLLPWRSTTSEYFRNNHACQHWCKTSYSDELPLHGPCFWNSMILNEVLRLNIKKLVCLSFTSFQTYKISIFDDLFIPACPCTRWPTQTWAGSWRARRSRKHFVHQSK